MKRIVFVISVVLFTVFVLSFAVSADQTRVNLKMQSAIPTKLPGVNNLHWFAKQISLVSNGSINIKIYEPGALVPPFQIQEAVSSGQINCGWSATVYMAGKMPAASLFTSVPFGPNITEYFSWFYFGNGTKLLQEMYDANGFNVKVWPMNLLPTESGGWFRKEIKSVKDFNGLRLRWPGLGGKVLSRMGASISTMPGGEIFPSLEKGAIDGAEFANPMVDNVLGFWKVAKYNYFPGWHQPSTAMEFMINKDVWNSMSESQKATIETMIMAINLRSIADIEAHVGPILKENMEKRGVKNMLYSKEILRTLKSTWMEVAQEECKKDPFFKKVYEDLEKFMNDYQVWECYSYTTLPKDCNY